MRPARSGETGLPATSPERQVVGLDSSNEGSRMRSSNMVGTPCTIVTRSRRINASAPARSEERRVGKECRARWAGNDLKKKVNTEAMLIDKDPNESNEQRNHHYRTQ